MNPQLTASLFPGQPRVEGSEIKFRAVCALGWAIRERFAELRSIGDNLPPPLDALHWLDYIEAGAIDEFNASHAATWPQMVSDALRTLTKKAAVESFPTLVKFLEQLAGDVTATKALDPISQLSDLNLRGSELASQMIEDPEWSTGVVAGKWNGREAHPCGFREDRVGNFQPVTTKDRIEFHVNIGKFEVKNALLFYLTLEFQMMHEYISHLLPVWNSGNALEEEFLLAVMFLYYRERGPRNGLVSLVLEADERRADSHRGARRLIKDELAPLQERRLTQLLLELAVLDEEGMIAAEKRHLLALLKKVPFQEEALAGSIRSWIAHDDAPTLYGRLRTAIG